MSHALEQLNNIERDQSFPNSRPRDAATLIVVDRSESTAKVLMGRRHGGHKFMPGKFVFPGGRVERSDALAPAIGELDPRVETALMERTIRPSRKRARALGLAAIRETFEETGLLIGDKAASSQAQNGVWAAFANEGFCADLSHLQFIARAITPPRRPKRFDTRFFVADASRIAHRVEGLVGPDSELVELVWLPVEEAKRLDIPTVTRIVLEELQARTEDRNGDQRPIPFYYVKQGQFTQEMLS